MTQNSRRLRGRRTEHVVANYFAEVWETASVVNSGASGSDAVGTPFDIVVSIVTGGRFSQGGSG